MTQRGRLTASWLIRSLPRGETRRYRLRPWPSFMTYGEVPAPLVHQIAHDRQPPPALARLDVAEGQPHRRRIPHLQDHHAAAGVVALLVDAHDDAARVRRR